MPVITPLTSETSHHGRILIQRLEGFCGHTDRWPHVRTFIRNVFNRPELICRPIERAAVAEARADVLDCLHAAYSNDPSWPLIRNRALNAFGVSGLEKLL